MRDVFSVQEIQAKEKEEREMIKAVGDLVVVEPIYVDRIGLIELSDKAKEDMGNGLARVISVGPENKDGLKKGDKVFFRKNEGTKIEDNLLSLKPEWIVAVVDNE